MSLRLRLALWYGTLTGLVVVVVVLIAYALHGRAHYDELDDTLVATAQHIAAEHRSTLLRHELAALLSSPPAADIALRIYDQNGAELAAGPNAGPAPTVDPRVALSQPSVRSFDPVIGLAPPLAAVDRGAGVLTLAAGADGGRWRLYVVPIGQPTQYLVVAAPLGLLDASVAMFRRVMALLAALGIGASFGGGYLVAGRALRPVAVLTDTAGGIARSRGFGRRVAASPSHDELGRLAATFNEMLTSLEQAYRAEQRFVADASHELRAPLTAIQANLELLERRPDLLVRERQEAVSEASREARRLAQLVADLLALARADAGVPIRRQRVELDRVVLDAFREARHLAHGQRLEVDHLDPVVVEGDPDRLKQLLWVLLDNAIKYTPPDGQVTLGLHRADVVATVAVRDTGIGIPAEQLAQVFDRFFRADPARARDPGGTGLGLAIAKWIAEQHGGEIRLTSEPGRGTAATVRLPVVQPAARTQQRLRSVSGRPQR